MTEPQTAAASADSPIDLSDGMPVLPSGPDAIPHYLGETYRWAYLSAATLPWLDRAWVVSAILWGNARRLMRAAVVEFDAGQRIIQAACVYGGFSRLLAERVGATGQLTVLDVAPLQLANARRKLADLPHVALCQGDLARPSCIESDSVDGVCCFFLLHEVPPAERARIVDNLLGAVRSGGKVVFVDYHRMRSWHPLRPVMAAIFRWLEPYAPSLLDARIDMLSARGAEFVWSKSTLFGGLYQKLVGIRRA